MDLVLDSGDMFHGQSIATLVQGESIAQLVKACGYDAMTAGNHDWNYGKDRLKELTALADIEMLANGILLVGILLEYRKDWLYIFLEIFLVYNTL